MYFWTLIANHPHNVGYKCFPVNLLFMGKKMFWSRDRLVKHEIGCLGLWSGLWIASGLGLGLGFM